MTDLQQTARQIRCDTLRMIHQAGSGHPGAALSCVEIVTALYFRIMRIDPDRPDWRDRDRFILSKGHACPAHYAALARRGFFPIEELYTLRRVDSRLQGHPDMNKTPGVDMTSGSLGNGLACGVGMALAAKMDRLPSRIYVLLGDGELQEGIVWEAAMAAAHYRLDNLTAIVDSNGLQLDGRVCEVMNIEPLADKWRSFRWRVINCDGHDFMQLIAAFEQARTTSGTPCVIVADTTKGKGVSFME
ncbi:MAG: transketolase, partial [Armatimonadota bacterium]